MLYAAGRDAGRHPKRSLAKVDADLRAAFPDNFVMP
jgi:hypothetical protein